MVDLRYVFKRIKAENDFWLPAVEGGLTAEIFIILCISGYKFSPADK